MEVMLIDALEHYLDKYKYVDDLSRWPNFICIDVAEYGYNVLKMSFEEANDFAMHFTKFKPTEKFLPEIFNNELFYDVTEYPGMTESEKCWFHRWAEDDDRVYVESDDRLQALIKVNRLRIEYVRLLLDFLKQHEEPLKMMEA